MHPVQGPVCLGTSPVPSSVNLATRHHLTTRCLFNVPSRVSRWYTLRSSHIIKGKLNHRILKRALFHSSHQADRVASSYLLQHIHMPMSPPVTPARFRHAPEYLFPHAQSSLPDLVRANTVQNQNASNASRKAGYVHPKSSAV